MKEKDITEDKYAKELIKKVKEVEIGLDYYIKHSQQLENELNQYKIMYENRVEEYLKLKKENRELKDSVIEIKLYALQTENEKQKKLIERMKTFLLKENKMCDFLESEE